MTSEQSNINVVVRVRPYNRREISGRQRCVVKVMNRQTLLFDPDEEDDEFFFQGAKQNYRDLTKRVNKKISMEFDQVYDTEATNEEIFEECTSPLIDSVLNGYNCSVFVYGATGAGKTFTMLGNSICPGLTLLTMRDLFAKIEAQSVLRKFDVGVSYLEVYNEHVMNLLTKSGPLKLREDSNGVVVSGLVLKPIFSAAELLELLTLGNSNRTQHPTDANAESSRSHAIFQVHIRMTDRNTGNKRTVKLSMIDLAGSERAASTKGIGVRFKEGASINRSLLALGNCINKLADGLKHIPYRDSNLTRILKDSLGGNCRTLMVANVSMSSLTYEDTYNTLKYASRAKKIRTTLRQNLMKSNMPKDFYVRKVQDLMAESEQLKEAKKALEDKVALLQKTETTSVASVQSYSDSVLKSWYSKIDAVYSSMITTQVHVMNMQSKIKFLNFRNKLREETTSFCKILTLNHKSSQENGANLVDSLSRSDMQNEKQTEELTRWRNKLQGTYKDLDMLKKAIMKSEYANILQIYRRTKDLEVENSMQKVNVDHISAINSEFVVNSYKMGREFGAACGLLQKSYDNMNDTQTLTAEVKDGFEQLQRLMRSQNIKVKNENKKNSDTDLDLFPHQEMLSGNRAELANFHDDTTESSKDTNRNPNKRLYFEANEDNFHLNLMDDSTDDCCDATITSGDADADIFKIPGATATSVATERQKLNVTQVLGELPENINSTFCLSTLAPFDTAVRAKKVLVTNLLSEQIADVPSNKNKLKSILLKSKNFGQKELQKTVAIGVQKENQKYGTLRIRKSPRSLLSRMPANDVRNVPKLPSRNVTSISEGPLVRINRAASFRVKKQQ